MGPYLLSHHPHCGPFRSDVVMVAGRRFCVACFVGYPVLVVAFIAGLAMYPRLDAVWWTWCAGGVLLFSAQGLSFAGAVHSWQMQVMVKVLMACGIASAVVGLLHAPVSFPWRVAAIAAALIAMQAMWMLRMLRLERTCRRCPQYGLRPGCEGLRELDARVGHLLALPGTTALGGPALDTTPVSSRKP